MYIPEYSIFDRITYYLSMFLQELRVLGFPSLFTASRNGEGPADTFDIVKLINCAYELLQLQQRHMKVRTDLEER